MTIKTVQIVKRGRQGINGTLGFLTTATKATNFQAVEAEKAYCYVCTDEVTVTFQSAAALGNGWMCYVEAAGGDVTLDPTETINGEASIVIPNGALALVFTDGSTFRSYFLADTPGFEWQGPWATSTAYVVRDTVQAQGATYTCVANHTSGVFADDLGAGRWELVAERGSAGGVGWDDASEYQGGLNSITTTGWRRLGGGATNFPSGIAGGVGPQGDMVLTLYYSANLITQMYVEITGQVWVRSRVETSPGFFQWIAWRGLGVREWANTWTAANTFTGAVDLTAATVTGLYGRSPRVLTESGSSFDFPDIPAWANEVTIMFQQVSVNAEGRVFIQLGTSGGISVEGYESVSQRISGTSSILMSNSVVNIAPILVTGTGVGISGSITLKRMDAERWVSSGSVGDGQPVRELVTVSGYSFLGGQLTQVRVGCDSGATAFDSGALAVSWRA